MATGDIYRATMVFSNAVTGRNITTGLHLRQVGVGWDANNVSDLVRDGWNVGYGTGSPLQDFCPEEIALEAIEIQRVVPLEAIILRRTDGLPLTGIDATDDLPSQDSAIVSIRTAQTGRSFRGRMYLPPFAEDQNNAGGVMDASVAQEVADQIHGWFTHIDTGDGEVGVFSRTRFAGPGTNYFNPWTAVLVDRYFRTQRRRASANRIYETGA